jgi:hypothetical protein
MDVVGFGKDIYEKCMEEREKCPAQRKKKNKQCSTMLKRKPLFSLDSTRPEDC